MYNASMKAVVKIRDNIGNTNTNKINYKQNNEDIQINIDNNGQQRQYNLTTDDVGALMDNLNSSNLEQRLLLLGNSMTTNKQKTRKHKPRKQKTRKQKTRKQKQRKTRKDKGKHHKKHKKQSVRFRTPTPYPR